MADKRIFVEKRTGFFDVPAQKLCANLKLTFDLTSLKYIRIFQRYDIKNISDEDYEDGKNIVFCNPSSEVLYEDELPLIRNARVLVLESWPDSVNSRKNIIKHTTKTFFNNKLIDVDVAEVFVFVGNLTDRDFAKLCNYFTNDVEWRLQIPTDLSGPQAQKSDVEKSENFAFPSDFFTWNEKQLRDFYTQENVPISWAEFTHFFFYFKGEEKRLPSNVEWQLLQAIWRRNSKEHNYDSELSTVVIDNYKYNMPIKEAYTMYNNVRTYVKSGPKTTLRDIVTITNKQLLQAEKIPHIAFDDNDGRGRFVVPVYINDHYEDWLISCKCLSRNVFTQQAPFSGAINCLSSVVRYPLADRTRVYQTMHVSVMGNPSEEHQQELFPTLLARSLARQTVNGRSRYGNRAGITTGFAKEYYHNAFQKEHCEVDFAIGAVQKNYLSTAEPLEKDIIFLIGSHTGREGQETSNPVARGDSFQFIRLQEFLQKPEILALVKKCQTVDEVGILGAILQMAAGKGFYIMLDNIPVKSNALNPVEILTSTTQERLLVIVSPRDAAKFNQACQIEGISATLMAQLFDDERVRIHYQENLVCDLHLNVFASKPFPKAHAHINASNREIDYFSAQIPSSKNVKNIERRWCNNMQDSNVASQAGLVEYFDATIGRASLMMPLGGSTQRTPAEGMAAKLPSGQDDTMNVATLTAHGFEPTLSVWNPFYGAVYAIVIALGKIVAMGGDYQRVGLNFQINLPNLSTDSEMAWGSALATVLGIFRMQNTLELPTLDINTEESMSTAGEELSSAIAFAICPVLTDNVVTSEFKLAGNHVYILPLPRDLWQMPDLKVLKQNYTAFQKLVKARKVYSAMSITQGGLAATLSKMCLGENIGFSFTDDLLYSDDKMFEPSYGSIVFEVASDADLSELAGTKAQLLGKTIRVPSILYGRDAISLLDIDKGYSQALADIYAYRGKKQVKSTLATTNFQTNNIGLKAESVFAVATCSPFAGERRGNKKAPNICFDKGNVIRKDITYTVPNVFLPTFAGSIGLADLEMAVKHAGAKATKMFINTEVARLELEQDFIKALNKAQIMILGSGDSRIMTAFLHHARLAEALHNFLYNRDGLILGIDSGFQTLLNLGFLPEGRLLPVTTETPTLTYNEAGHYISTFAYTKVVSNLSPWLTDSGLGHVDTVPVAGLKCKFYASQQTLAFLRQNGQIATQFVDSEGNPSMEYTYNPGGSIDAIEGITSPEGRVFGKIGHCERNAFGLTRNIHGTRNQDIIQSGVNYFRA